jgi:cytochrome c5
MTRRPLALALAVALAAPVAAAASRTAQSSPRSVWSGVYTSAQATRGAEGYTRSCVDCHGDDLEGREKAPALAGATFAQRWDGASLKKLLARMEEMPPDDSAPRPPAGEYIDILAFLLSANHVPAGAQPLTADKDALAAITFTSRSHF